MTLRDIGLFDKSDSFVHNLSGGQQKRLSIALELVDDPEILFLDEPTTGLDSSSSNQCVELLKKLADKGKTVICTIHAPSAGMLKMFDHLYVLAEGSCIYQGSSKNLISFLSELDLLCPQSYNPSDFLLEVANDEYGSHNDRLVMKMENGKNENYRKDAEKADICDEFEAWPTARVEKSFLCELWNLTCRNFLILYRDKSVMKQRLSIHLAVAICFIIVFQNAGQEASKIFAIAKLFFAMTVLVMYAGFYSMVARFNLENATITREHFNRWHSTGSYYLAMTIADIPITLACTTLFVTTVYFATNQPLEEFRFFIVLGVQILLSFTSQGLGLMVGSIFSLMVCT
jgi:ATP-binding cassette, subfamily G (WHITE), member 1